jgi:hypothetical protein
MPVVRGFLAEFVTRGQVDIGMGHNPLQPLLDEI